MSEEANQPAGEAQQQVGPLNSKVNTWASNSFVNTFGAMITALAIPTAILLVWLPREFDKQSKDLSSIDERLGNFQKATIEELQSIEAASGASLVELKSIKQEISNDGDDDNLWFNSIAAAFAVAQSPAFDRASRTVLQSIFPQELVRKWEDTGNLAKLKAVKINDSSFVFVEDEAFKRLPVAEQELINAVNNWPAVNSVVWSGQSAPFLERSKITVHPLSRNKQ